MEQKIHEKKNTVTASDKEIYSVKSKIDKAMCNARVGANVFKLGADFIVRYKYLDMELIEQLCLLSISGNLKNEMNWLIRVLEEYFEPVNSHKQEYYFYMTLLRLVNNDLKVLKSGNDILLPVLKDKVKMFFTETVISALMDQGRMDAARRLIDVLSPVFKEFSETQYSPFLYNLGKDFYDLGDYEKSLVFYRKAIKFDPYESDNWKGSALCYEKMGKMNLAKECWKRILSIRLSDATRTIADEGRPEVQKKRLKKNQKLALKNISKN